MRKAFAPALIATLMGGLVAAAIGGGAADRMPAVAYGEADARASARAPKLVYDGTLKRAGPDTSVRITAKQQRGEPKSIKRLDYEGLPAQCEQSGSTALESRASFTGVRVNDKRKFKIVATSEDGDSSIRFSGKFSRSFRKVAGRLQETIHYGPENPPEQTCVGETRPYAAKR